MGVGTVLEYQKQFQVFLSNTRRVPREQCIIFSINGLKGNVKSIAQSYSPQAVHSAVCFAKKYEQDPSLNFLMKTKVLMIYFAKEASFRKSVVGSTHPTLLHLASTDQETATIRNSGEKTGGPMFYVRWMIWARPSVWETIRKRTGYNTVSSCGGRLLYYTGARIFFKNIERESFLWCYEICDREWGDICDSFVSISAVSHRSSFLRLSNKLELNQCYFKD